MKVGHGSVDLYLPGDPRSGPPARVRVEEEDTFLVLSAPPEIPEHGPHPIRVMTAVWEAQPRAVPSVEKRGRVWLLVLHDLEREPSLDEGTLRAGLEFLFDEADREGVESLDVPLLGAVHGVVSATRAAELLREALSAKWFHELKRVLVRSATLSDASP